MSERSERIDGTARMSEITRVAVTPEAAELIRHLRTRHGALMFHQSGGCCDGSSPMCYPQGEFITSAADVLLGDLRIDGVLEPVPVWMSAAQFQYWRYTHLTIDVVPGRGAGFSVEAPEGVRFIIRSRLLTDSELAALGTTDQAFPEGSDQGPVR